MARISGTATVDNNAQEKLQIISFTPVPGTRFTADGFPKTMTVTLLPGRDFVRVSRL